MCEPAELIPSPPTSAVRNTVGRGNEQVVTNPNRFASDAALREYCDKTPNVRGEHRKGRRSERSRSMFRSPERTSVFSRIRHVRSESPRHRPVGNGRRDKGVFNRLGGKEKNVSAHSESHYQSSRSRRTDSVPRKRHYEGTCSRRTEMLSESEDSEGGHWKSKLKKKKSSIEEDDLSQPWKCDPEDHLKIFQAAAKVERWAIPTWCHIFDYTLAGSARVWFDDLPPESVDIYNDLKKAFLANFLQQKKCIKDPVEIHHVKQREGESTEDFVQRFKSKSRHVKGASECIRISEFMHEITNPELIKCLHYYIPKSVDEMIRVTTTFLMGEVAASNQAPSGSKEPNGSSYHNPHWFRGEIIWPMGQIFLQVKIGDVEHSTSRWMNFVVARSPSSYNEIIGRPGVRKIQAVSSTAHRMLKFPVPGGILTLRRHDRGSATPSGASPERPRRTPSGQTKENKQAPERNKAIQEKVAKLIDARIMKQVHYHSWLSNPVMVKKYEDSWRMCVDFKDLNKACLKDGYPLPEIDWKEDEEKTAFITSQGIFYYSKMPFGPKNAGATYQRLVDKAFQKQIGRNLEVYVDDLVIKSHTKQEIIRDIEEMFRALREKNMKLNPKIAHSVWRKTSEAAFKQMKELELPTLTAPMEKKKLIAYLTAAREANRKGGEANASLFHFIVERPKDDSLVTPTEAEEELPDPWTLFTHGSSYIDGSGAGLILTNPEGTEFTYALRFRFDATNNEADCEALIAGLRIIEQMEVLAVVEEEGDTWMNLIYEYLTEETLPAKKEKARVVRRKSRRYAVINEVLYKKTYLGPWLRYVGPLQANYVLREIHDGSCNMHVGTRSVVAKAIRTGYYWPTIHANAKKMIQECEDFQVHRPMPRNPQQKLTPIMSPDNPFKDCCEKFCNHKRFASVMHLQANGLVEKANRSLGEGIKVRNTSFKPKDLMYRNNDASHARDSKKLGPKWEGPYKVMEALGKGAYKLRDRDEKLLPRTWNVCSLKKCCVYEM
nr:reverse transcriptase domain-containing protein [Tanacetum cinerariifolium]